MTVGSRLSRIALPAFTVAAVVFLFAPIAVMIIFSFNDPAGRQNITWQGFTLENYLTVWSRPDITGPLLTSLAIATISTVVRDHGRNDDGPGPDPVPVPRLAARATS